MRTKHYYIKEDPGNYLMTKVLESRGPSCELHADRTLCLLHLPL